MHHAAAALSAKLIDPSAVGSHNLRVELALAQLNKHLALAVQSVWESHFRRWLRLCAKELDRPVALLRRIQIANTPKLDDLLFELRGRRMADLAGGQLLHELVLVGNVVRHGDGPSALRLNALRPDIWLNPPNPESEGGLDDLASELAISVDRLEAYAQSVSDFWLAISSLSGPTEMDPWPFEDHSEAQS
ncbi:hypothetical protein GCM10023325_12380 [Sphingomonas lutea]